MTWPEIEHRVGLGGLTGAEQDELWDCLFLTLPEVEQLLEHVKRNAAHGWIYPAVFFAAHTGARRSEILRARPGDLDLDGGFAHIHEKKRARGTRTTRRVPLSPLLVEVLGAWLAARPAGTHLFCHQDEVPRSKKRSPTTGHKGGRTRPRTQRGRAATVRARAGRPVLGMLTRDEAHDHFRRTLEGSKWGRLRGWHVLRHSFVSNCAARGVDQRVIDTWVGHQTEEMRKRYRHLIPSAEQAAIRAVFGPGGVVRGERGNEGR
jgi:integrase